MLISLKHQFVFVHVPKTAGASVATALDPFSDHPESLPINRCLSLVGINTNHFGKTTWRRCRVHASARQIRKVYGAARYDDLFAFAFVRNPWARMVSYYHYVSSRESHHRKHQVQRLHDFKQYLHYEAARGKSLQSAMLNDAHGDLLVDFVGRFENLVDDFRAICGQIGVTAPLPHRNASSHEDYRTYYDDESAEFVATHWREDIERFGYAFDDAQTLASA